MKIDVEPSSEAFTGILPTRFPWAEFPRRRQSFIKVTKKSFELGMAAAAAEGARIGDIGAAVDGYVTGFGFSTVKKYVGHGVGHDLHEDPSVPNYGRAGHGPGSAAVWSSQSNR